MTGTRAAIPARRATMGRLILPALALVVVGPGFDRDDLAIALRWGQPSGPVHDMTAAVKYAGRSAGLLAGALEDPELADRLGQAAAERGVFVKVVLGRPPSRHVTDLLARGKVIARVDRTCRVEGCLLIVDGEWSYFSSLPPSDRAAGTTDWLVEVHSAAVAERAHDDVAYHYEHARLHPEP